MLLTDLLCGRLGELAIRDGTSVSTTQLVFVQIFGAAAPWSLAYSLAVWPNFVGLQLHITHFKDSEGVGNEAGAALGPWSYLNELNCIYSPLGQCPIAILTTLINS